MRNEDWPSTRTVLRVVGVLLAVAIGLYLVWLSRGVLTWVAIAAFLAVAINPLVSLFQKRLRLRRAAAILMVYVIGTGLVAGAALVFVPPLIEAGQQLTEAVPDLERMLVQSGLILVKYWLEVSPEQQEKRFRERAEDPTKRWKLSPIDLKARDRYDEYTEARDVMFARTNILEAPWYVVDADSQKRARLNLMAHLLEILPYRREDDPPKLPKRKRKGHEASVPSGVRTVPERW